MLSPCVPEHRTCRICLRRLMAPHSASGLVAATVVAAPEVAITSVTVVAATVAVADLCLALCQCLCLCPCLCLGILDQDAIDCTTGMDVTTSVLVVVLVDGHQAVVPFLHLCHHP